MSRKILCSGTYQVYTTGTVRPKEYGVLESCNLEHSDVRYREVEPAVMAVVGEGRPG